MSLKDQLAEDLKDAMRQGDETRKTAIRLTIAAVKNAEVPEVSTILARDNDTFESIAARNRVDPDALVSLNSYPRDWDFGEGEVVIISHSAPAVDDG
ncbi:MAG TPA: GatB/YqeY domain-containing protein, partial [Dehalococcoidia bacterium]|nr:GatB/YqeY domain-containing protein [Dehalococcoidia bacterium]